MKKKKVCKKGKSCGVSCINANKTCRKELPPSVGTMLDKVSKGGIPEGEELVRLSREWSKEMGFKNSHDKYKEDPKSYSPYHDDVHILVHKMLGKNSQEINPRGKNSVSFKEEAMVEYFIYEFARGVGTPFEQKTTRAKQEKLAQDLLEEMYNSALELGFKKTAEDYAPDKREAMAKEIVDLFDSADPTLRDKAMDIYAEMRAGAYDNYSESEQEEELVKRRKLFTERMKDEGEEL